VRRAVAGGVLVDHVEFAAVEIKTEGGGDLAQDGVLGGQGEILRRGRDRRVAAGGFGDGGAEEVFDRGEEFFDAGGVAAGIIFVDQRVIGGGGTEDGLFGGGDFAVDIEDGFVVRAHRVPIPGAF